MSSSPAGAGGISHGADVEALRATAQELETAVEALAAAEVLITMRGYRLDWNGPDAARFRLDWETVHAPAMRQVARAMLDVAFAIASEAAAQEAVSSGGSGEAGAPPVQDLRARYETARSALMGMPDAARLGQAVAAANHSSSAAPILGKLDDAWQTLSRTGPLSGTAGSVLGGLGVAFNLHGLHEGYQEGDAAKLTQNGVPLAVGGLAAAGVIGSGTAAAVTVPFGVGSLIGNEINDAMEGTRYGDRVTANFETVFDTYGAAGMLLTPGVLIQSGVDMLVDPAPAGGDGAIGEAGDGVLGGG